MRCSKHFTPIQYIDIRIGQNYMNRGLCQRCISKQVEPGIITLKEGEDLMNQVYEQRSDEFVKIQTYYEGILKEIQALLDSNKLKIFEILSELYQKSVSVYEGYSECQQLADQLSKDIIFNQNQLQIKPLIYEDPILSKNHSKLNEILNILKPTTDKIEIELKVDVVKYQISRPQKQTEYSKQTIQLYGHRGQVNEVAFSNDCTMAASGGHDASVILWNLKSMQQLKKYKGENNIVYCVAFSKCDTLLASGEKSNMNFQIKIWDIKNLKQDNPLYILNGHTKAIYHIVFAERFLVSCSMDRSIRLWKQDKQIECYQMKSGVMGVTLSKDEQLIAANDGSYISIWHVQKSKIISKWRNQRENQEGGICFSNNSKVLFQSSWNQGHLKAWNLYTENPKQIRKTKFNYAFDCSVSSDSTILATADATYDDNKGLIHLIDISTWKLTQDLNVIGGYAEEGCGSYNYANFSRDDQYIGTGSGDGSIRIFKREEEYEI